MEFVVKGMVNLMAEKPPETSKGSEADAQTSRLAYNSITAMNVLFRQFLAITGLVLIGVAIPIAIVTPLLPIGLPIAIFGVVLLGRNSLWGRRWMESVLARHPTVERFAPNWLMKTVFGRSKSERFRKTADTEKPAK